MVSMVAFHLCYDLAYIVRLYMPWFPPIQTAWSASISWAFLILAGIMCSLSHNNLKRSVKYAAVALAVFVVTSLISVDAPISFGIIYCMAFSTFVVWVLDRLGHAPTGLVAAGVLFVLFLLAYSVPVGYVGIGDYTCPMPRALYNCKALAFLGFPGPGFVSSDYYPPIPYTLLYLSGCALGRWWLVRGFAKAIRRCGFPPLEFVGRHSLLVYVAHQPVLLAVISLVTGHLPVS